MHEGHGPERWLSRWRGVEQHGGVRRHCVLIQHAKLHEEVVRMLAVDERLPVACLARLQQQGITALPHRCCVDARHEAELKTPPAYHALGHDHRPVQAAPLVVASWPSLMVVLPEAESTEHHPPTAA